MKLAIVLFAALHLVFVPLDDRPVTYQLPELLGRIAGREVVTPPRALLGNYLHFGKPDAIIAWLNRTPPAQRYVISADMLAYGGLVASRIPGVTYADAYSRFREFDTIRRRAPGAWIGTFGTVMRLAPTGVPALGDAAHFFAAYPGWEYLQDYANLPDPPQGADAALAQKYAALAGPQLLDAYLQTRYRNYAVDHALIARAASGSIDRLVLGQDDAKPTGLHVKELHALQSFATAEDAGARVSIEPGADELGMAMVANALAQEAHWHPRIAVAYSTPDGAAYQDPLEFAPISVTVDGLISLCGGVRDDVHPDVTLFVRVPSTTPPLDDALLAAIGEREESGASVALADVSFEESFDRERAFAQRILQAGVASKLDAYASWNTSANTIGTALAEAIAAGAGRRMHSYDRLAHRTFTFMRFVDDVDYHVFVRPDLDRWLAAQGVTDHTYLLPAVAAATAERNRALLWHDAGQTLAQLYPGYHIASMRITLPWDRTFETRIDVGLAPNL